MMSKKQVNVAIALLLNQARVLVGWRQASQHQGNKYEFPGGKVEAGETPEQACQREIFEEVGIHIAEWHAFDVIRHEYEDVIVSLHVFHAAVPATELAKIQQPWQWYSRQQLTALNFPKANDAILQRLVWPAQIKISEQLSALQQSIADQLFYWRLHGALSHEQKQQLHALPKELSRRLIVNLEIWQQLDAPLQQAIRTIHLKQSQLLNLRTGELPVGYACIAACHDLASLQQAHRIGCDAVLLSPVLPTPTHPEFLGLGWQNFAEIARKSALPVFALGGVKPEDLSVAVQHGGYGVAGIRSF